MDAANIRRRQVLALLAALPAASWAAPAAAPDRAGERLAPWRPGWLDIHHIATGRGNATFVLLPDGTSLMIDAGASGNALDVSVAPRPDASRRPGEYIGRYAARHLRGAGLDGLDYLLATHTHPDHTDGIADVAAQVAVRLLVDRGYPDYDYPVRIDAPFANEYRAYVAARRKAGQGTERFRVGSAGQFAARGHRPATLPFEVRNIAANGEVWTGQAQGSRTLFPDLATLPRADWPNENQCSAAIRIGYGRFRYFTGGDMTSYTADGALPWQDVLGPASRAAGPVSVATSDHHGMFDSLNGDIVRTLRPRVWVIPSWHIAHPDMLQLERMFSERLYPGPRDVFATTVMRENLLANGRLTKRLRSTDGHVVVRVAPGGDDYYVAVTGNGDEADTVRMVTDWLAA